MDKEFKVSGKEIVLGRLRNIFAKMKKRLGKQGGAQPGKTKYIKCKGEFVKLSTYIKEHDKVNKADKDGKIVKINKKISVINNISKIKDKKIRNLLLKTFKKNAKIYFISDNKKWHGKGGVYTGFFDKDVKTEKIDNGTDRGNYFVSPRQLLIQLNYDDKVDAIISHILLLGLNTDLFQNINNIIYTIKLDDINHAIIRPSIVFTPNKHFYIYFYIYIDDKWIHIPIHITLFLYDMVKSIPDNKLKFRTGFIHITSNSNIIPFFENKNHLYLHGSNFSELAKIMGKHGNDMFENCGYDTVVSTDTELYEYNPNETKGVWEQKRDSKFNFNKYKISFNKMFRMHLPIIIKHLFLIIDNNDITQPFNEESENFKFSILLTGTGYFTPKSVSSPIFKNTKIEYKDSSNNLKRNYDLDIKSLQPSSSSRDPRYSSSRSRDSRDPGSRSRDSSSRSRDPRYSRDSSSRSRDSRDHSSRSIY